MILYRIPYSLIIEWMCLITSIFLLRNTIPKFWQTFIPYLAITVGVETYAYISIVFFDNTNTHLAYNIFLLIYISYHNYIFSKIIDLPHAKKIVLVCYLFLLGWYGYEFFMQGLSSFLSETNTLFGGSIILLSMLYYFSIFKQDELKQSEFWFVTGCLIFYAVTTGVNAFFDQLPWLNQKNSIPIRFIIVTLANITMYGCWIKSFLCLKDNQIYFRRSL